MRSLKGIFCFQSISWTEAVAIIGRMVGKPEVSIDASPAVDSDPENRDYASSPQLCLGSYSDFVLKLHMLSPARPSLWLVYDFNEPSASQRVRSRPS